MICFCCGTGLKDWEHDDVPLLEHAKHSKGCEFINLKKDEIESIKQLMGQSSKSNGLEIKDETTKEPSDPNALCKICLMRTANLVFLPCKHVVSCDQCVSGLKKKCPICRNKIEDKIRLYYT